MASHQDQDPQQHAPHSQEPQQPPQSQEPQHQPPDTMDNPHHGLGAHSYSTPPNNNPRPSHYPTFNDRPQHPPDAFNGNASNQGHHNDNVPNGQHGFDITAWYPYYQSCQRYLLEHGQYTEASEVLAAFINIKLPHQLPATFRPRTQLAGTYNEPSRPPESLPSLYPYIRRLIVTGFCKGDVLRGLFGEDWLNGLADIIESERRNYLFTAKSVNWTQVKGEYDMDDGQTCPFLKPLEDALEEEVQGAERSWGKWLAMQDWMVGPRAPGMRGRYRNEY